MKKEYITKVKKVLTSKFNGVNVIKAIIKQLGSFTSTIQWGQL